MKTVALFLSITVFILSSIYLIQHQDDFKMLIAVIASIATTIKYGIDVFKSDKKMEENKNQVQIVSGHSRANQAGRDVKTGVEKND